MGTIFDNLSKADSTRHSASPRTLCGEADSGLRVAVLLEEALRAQCCDEVGVRPIVDADTVYDLLRRIPHMDISMADNWNKRYRENMQRIKSGDLSELAAVIKALTQRDEKRPLSTGERRMLNQARQILLSEISLSVNCPYDFAEVQLDQCLRNRKNGVNKTDESIF